MGVKTGCFLVTWAVLLASGRATSVEDREFIEAKQPSLLPSNEGKQI